MKTKHCHNCSSEFQIDPEDQVFYQKIQVPEPTHCPDCRRQRRLAFRNERNLYHRNCDLCKIPVISIYPKETDFTVYCNTCWWSDKWDPMDYGREFDFDRPFFEQFQELSQSIPHFALHQDGSSENCEYVNYGISNKSCYLSLAAFCENVYFSHTLVKSKSCMDCHKCVSCELCYDCVDCDQCYKLFFSQDCQNCSESAFLKDCIGARNCFASVGLRNKQYVFANEQLSKEEYNKRLKKINYTAKTIQQWKQERDKLSSEQPKKYLHGTANEEVSGDYLDHCKNVKESYDCLDRVENSKYCDTVGLESHDLFDCSYMGMKSSQSYEVNGAVMFTNCQFIFSGRTLSDCQYCQNCFEGHDLFGCLGLRHKEYCILNKQYSKEEYQELVSRITDQMKVSGEYGEFFPISLSDYAYNESVAFEYFPMSKEEVLAKGWKWREKRESPLKTEKTLPAEKLPADISEVPDDILNWAIEGEQSHRPFRIIKQELDFYRKHGLPIPREHPDIRHQKRLALRNPRKLFDRVCGQCGEAIRTSFSSERPEKIYCERCYLKAFS